MDDDTGHIKMTRVFRTSIITQLNKIKIMVSLTRSFIKKNWNMFAVLDGISLHIYTLFQVFGA